MACGSYCCSVNFCPGCAYCGKKTCTNGVEVTCDGSGHCHCCAVDCNNGYAC